MSNEQVAAFVAPKTGPGSMLAFMTEQSEVDREVVRHRERLSDSTARRVAANRSEADQGVTSANRDFVAFQDRILPSLDEGNRVRAGNVQPIKVHPELPRVDIVFGHRWRQACLELYIPVLALQSEMRDAELFVEMERENREREDLSAWEQGALYMLALEQGLWQSSLPLRVRLQFRWAKPP